MIAPETDFAIFVVVEKILPEDFGKIRARRMERRPRPFEGAAGDVVKIHFGGLRRKTDRGSQQTSD